ncbi:MAG: RNA polymerase sigma factor [Oscillospiraceae bacterium]|nr:RNA polymerase sigma factor [Oscillospiraceae bacterium]
MWEELYEKHYPELLRYAAAACRNQEEAEDAAQEVFLKALQNADVIQDLGPSQRRAWLYRTLKNTLCDRWRRGKQEEACLDTLEPEAASPDPGIQAVENALLLQCLSSEDRALFHLRYEEGYNAAELSQMLGIPAGTIRARLSRMRTILKTMLE